MSTITASAPDPLRSCRFCLRAAAKMRPLADDVHQLPQHTEAAKLFENVTGSPLDRSPGYSELWCIDCEQRLRSAAQIRADFVRVAQRWQEILYGVVHDDALVKAEQQTTDAVEDSGSCDDGLEEKFVLIEIDDVKQEAECVSERPDVVYDHDDNGINESPSSSDDESGSTTPLIMLKRAQAKPKREPKRSFKDEAETVEVARPRRGRRQAFGKPPHGDPLTCDICNAQLSTKNILISHMRKKHQYPKPTTDGTSAASSSSAPSGGSTCHICGKTNLKYMVHHMRDHRRADQYKCAHCPKTFCRLDMQLQHERTHTGDRPFVCEVCGFSFTSPTGLKRHMQLRHGAANGKHAALAQRPQKPQIVRQRVLPPPLPTVDLAAMLKKMPTLDGGRLECPMCQNTYANRPSLHTHMKIQHGAEGVARWKHFLATVCVVCNEQFADADALNEHRRVHQPYQCEICRRRFESRITWELHVTKHVKKERRYKCGVCEALFPCSFTLRMHHRRAHTDYRPFPCSQCDLAFAENAEMVAHMRKKHTGSAVQRTFACELCPPEMPAFRTTEALRSHMENHTGQFRYQCKVCLRRQTSAVQLLEHMRAYHPAELKAMDAGGADVEQVTG